MSQYVCDIDGEFVVVEKTGREATNRFNGLGKLVEVFPEGERHRPCWVPVNHLFELEDADDV